MKGHSKIYSSVLISENAGYLINTFVSAALDFYLILNLGRSWFFLLLLLAIGIELTKQICLIRANTLKTIKTFVEKEYTKVIKTKIFFYTLFFFVFTCLSAISSIGFSLVLSNKTTQSYDIEKTSIQKNIDSLTESKNAYLEANNKYTLLQQNSDDTEKEAKNKLRETEDAYNKIVNEVKDEYNNLSQEYDKKEEEFGGVNTAEFKAWLNEVNYSEIRDVAKGKKETTEISEARIAYERAKEDYDDLTSGKAITRAKATAEAAKQEYDSKVELLGSIDSNEIRLKEIAKEELDNASSSKEFILIARTFKLDDHTDKIKFFLFLVLAVVTEIGIVINSPKIILNDEILGLYARDLPPECDLAKLKKKIAKYNKDFGYDKIIEEYKLPKEIKSQIKSLEKENSELKKGINIKNSEIENLNKEIITSKEEVKNLSSKMEEKKKETNPEILSLIDEIENMIKE